MSPKSVAFPVVAISTYSAVFTFAGHTIPSATTALVGDDAADVSLQAPALISPKSVAFPVVEMVTN